MSAQEHSPDPQIHSDLSRSSGKNVPEKTSLSSPLLVYAGVFVVGLLIGWFVLGWYLFPVKYTEVYPSDLRPDIQDEYILMVAESYAATHDLRTAAKRLRYWEPEDVAVKIRQMAQALGKIEPERTAYLQVLAKDLHLDATLAAPAQPSPAPSRGAKEFPLSSILGMAAFLVLTGLVVFLARRRGLIKMPQLARPEETPVQLQPSAPTPTPTDTTYEDLPIHTMPVSAPPPTPPEPARATTSDQEAMVSGGKYEFTPLPERESIWKQSQVREEAPSEEPPWSPDLTEEPTIEAPEEYEAPIEAPDGFTTVPSPPPAEEETFDAERVSEFGRPQTLAFDGSPDYNTIVPIEIDHDFGQFVLGVAFTAPHNPNQALGLEALLYDRNDIRTVSALLIPPILANDRELLAQFTDQDKNIFPLEPGATFALETTFLSVKGKVRKVQFGPRTHEGAPVIEYAEIEFIPQRTGEAM